MTERGSEIEAFLARHGMAGAKRLRLAGDASVRRYERLVGGPQPAVLMDAPPSAIDVRPFLEIARWLRAAGLSAPEVLAADPASGLVLLEDLGDDLFEPRPRAGRRRDPLLRDRGRRAAGCCTGHRRRPRCRLTTMPGCCARRSCWSSGTRPGLDAAAKADYRAIWQDLLPAARVGAAGFVYVDYHAANLLWLPARTGLARVGLLDFQDARLGPCAYDLVSLLEDARRDVAPDLAGAMLERYLAARLELDEGAFRAAYALLGAQRNAKILGLFARLASRDRKPRYLDLLPRVRGHLARDLRHPLLGPLARWCASHLQLTAAP